MHTYLHLFCLHMTFAQILHACTQNFYYTIYARFNLLKIHLVSFLTFLEGFRLVETQRKFINIATIYIV